jgi:uncharacterized protein YecE (DUF72 family)
LREWRAPILELSEKVAQLHVLFNNNRANYAVVNGLQMAALLGLAYPQTPPGQQGLPLLERSGPDS